MMVSWVLFVFSFARLLPFSPALPCRPRQDHCVRVRGRSKPPPLLPAPSFRPRSISSTLCVCPPAPRRPSNCSFLLRHILSGGSHARSLTGEHNLAVFQQQCQRQAIGAREAFWGRRRRRLYGGPPGFIRPYRSAHGLPEVQNTSTIFAAAADSMWFPVRATQSSSLLSKTIMLDIWFCDICSGVCFPRKCSSSARLKILRCAGSGLFL